MNASIGAEGMVEGMVGEVVGLSIGELWSPRTDAGVVVQVVVTIGLIVGLSWLARRETAVVLLIVGVGLVLLGWYGFRAVH